MRLRRPPAGQGMRWVRLGFRTFYRRPLAFTGMFLAYWFAVVLMLVVPYAGTLASLVTLPLFTLGFMQATQLTLRDGLPTPLLFALPLRGDAKRRNALLRLGALYAVAMLVVVGLGHWIDGGALQALEDVMAAGQATREQLEPMLLNPQLQRGVLWRLALTALLSVPFWHAPALIYWDGQGTAQALFSSTLAVWRARAAFVVYGLGWLGVSALFGLLASVVFGLLGQPEMIGVAAMPAGLMFWMVFYASLYFTFIDSFEADAAPVPAPPT